VNDAVFDTPPSEDVILDIALTEDQQLGDWKAGLIILTE